MNTHSTTNASSGNTLIRLPSQSRLFLFPLLTIAILVLIVLELGIGTVSIGFKQVIAALF